MSDIFKPAPAALSAELKNFRKQAVTWARANGWPHADQTALVGMFGSDAEGTARLSPPDFTSLKQGKPRKAKSPAKVAKILIDVLSEPLALTHELQKWWVLPEIVHQRTNVLVPMLQNHRKSLALPAWDLIERLCDKGMPAAIAAGIAKSAKSRLYGGDPRLKLKILESVALGHAFERQVVKDICAEIAAGAAPFRAMTLHADYHGQGLSLALAQSVCDLSVLPRVEVYSIIGDAGRSLKLLQILNAEQAVKVMSWLRAKSGQVDQVVLVIDDVIDLEPEVARDLWLFLSALMASGAEQASPKFAIILGAFGTETVCFTHEVHPLELTGVDRNNCYLSMADGPDPLIAGHPGGLSELLRNHPVARQIGNDAQAFIDFLLECGGALAPEHWLAKIDEGEAGRTSLLILTAAAELLELPLPEAVALKSTPPTGVRWKNAHDLVASIQSLVWVDGKNPGIALACPRRAKSILRRAGQLSEGVIADTFGWLLARALSTYQNGEPGAPECLEFARHIVQRLGKRELYKFEGKDEIAQGVMSRFVEMITNRLAPKWNPSIKARWAGTIAPFVRARKPKQPGEALTRQAWARFAGDMATDWMAAIEAGAEPVSGDTVLSVMRAVTTLRKHRYRVPDAPALAGRLNDLLTAQRLTDLIDRALADNDVYRANELVHGWCRFQEARSAASNDAELSRWVFSVLEPLMERFDHRQARMDAATLIECARYIWLDKEDETKHRDALEMRLSLLREADSYLTEYSFAAGTWDARYKKEIAELSGANPKPTAGV